MGASIPGAVEDELVHDRAALKTHEIVLEVEPPFFRSQSRAQPIIRRRKHARTDAQATTEVGGDGGERFASSQPTCTLDMNSKVAIAEAEPVLTAER